MDFRPALALKALVPKWKVSRWLIAAFLLNEIRGVLFVLAIFHALARH